MSVETKVIKYKGKVVFEKVTMPRFKRVPKLYMEDEACFMFLDGGEFTLRSSSDIFKVNSQSALLSKCVNYFFELKDEDGDELKDVKCEAVGVMLHPSIISEVFDIRLLEPRRDSKNPMHKIDIDPLLKSFKDSIGYLIENSEFADEALIKIKLKEFVHLMMRQQQNESILGFISSLFNPVDYNIDQTIANNLYSNLSIEELAFLNNMSVSTFKRKFKEKYHTSPHQYLSKKKIEYACVLLQKADVNIAQVAFDCGFEDVSTFNRNFKKLMGVNPTAYLESERVVL